MPVFDYNRVYQAFGGCDMQAHINHIPVGTLQALTVSITREVVPIYTMGSADVKTFVKGKRGIAGSLSFSTFDRHALLYDVFSDAVESNKEAWYNRKSLADLVSSTDGFFYTGGNGESLPYSDPYSNPVVNPEEQDASNIQSVIDRFSQRKLRYSDELPPFNITLTMVNDWGAASTAHINGVVLINEGYGFTMDDLTNEVAFTYVAREVTPLNALSSGMFKKVGS